MRKQMTKPLLFSLLILLGTSCSTFSKFGSSNFQIKPVEEETLPNGLKILWLPDSSLPRISLNLLLEVGSLDESAGQEGLNALTAAMLDQGTAKHNAPELADALDQLGADINHSANSDFTTLSASGLSTTRKELLDLFAEIILTPAFQDAEVERERSVILAALTKTQDQPSGFADEKLDQEIFAPHPYGNSVLGKVKSVKGFRRTDLLRHYFGFYRPNNSILSVVGQIDANFKDEVRATLKGWGKSEVKRVAHSPAQAKATRTVLISKKGLQQTQIRMGHLGLVRSSPDFLSFRMANVILGGAFASRLNQRVRDDLGLTYSIHSSSDARLEPGMFEVSTFTRHEKTADTILETKKLVQDLVDKGITDQELDSAKALLIGQFPSAVETADKLAYNLMVLRRYGISDDYLKYFQRDVQRLTKAEVNASIKKNLHPENLQIVIFSDEKALGAEQLKRLGSIEKKSVTAE